MTDDRQPPIRSTTPAPDADGGTSDFGRFVSSSASKSFRQLSRERKRATTTRRPAEPTTNDPDVPLPEPPTRQGPIGRRWRDAAGAGRTDIDSNEGYAAAPNPPGESEPPSTPLTARLLDEDGRPRREVIVAVIAVILLIVLAVYLSSLGGDDNDPDADVTPTATTTNVIGGDTDPGDGTPPPTASSSPTASDTPRRTPEDEPTQESDQQDDVQVGGDNQRD